MHMNPTELHSNGDAAERSSRRFDVIVIGAGQAGLAMGYFLGRQGRRFVILDGADSIASAWRGRWDSLTLFTPRRYDGLPGLPFPGDPDGYPTRDEVIDYLEEYAKTFELPVELDSRVGGLTAAGEGYRVDVNGEILAADQIVVATGPFQTPFVPEIASGLAPQVVQMHSTMYRNPSDVPDRERTLGDPCCSSRYRIAADTASSEDPRTRPLLVANETGPDQQDRRLAHRAARPAPRRAHRLAAPRATTPLWRHLEAPRSSGLRTDGQLRRWDRPRRGRAHLGNRIPP
jgi:glycine/D-amino acid oxidase-like deaminating enzyme